MQSGRNVWSTEDAVVPDRISLREALYFVWSMPVSVLITGAENTTLIKEKIELARNFTAMSESRQSRIVEKVADLAEQNEIEYYKTA